MIISFSVLLLLLAFYLGQLRCFSPPAFVSNHHRIRLSAISRAIEFAARHKKPNAGGSNELYISRVKKGTT